MDPRTIPHRAVGTTTAAELVERLSVPDAPPFALLRRLDPNTGEPGDIEVLIGRVRTVERVADVPLPEEPGGGSGHEALALVPFRQIGERGFACHDDGTPLRVLVPTESHSLGEEELVTAVPDEPVHPLHARFDLNDDEYARIADRVVRSEIATGRGANFVLRRDFTAELDGYGPATALTLFGRLLASERGAYWVFAVHTPAEGASTGRTLIGASPEAHVRVTGDEALMNPISGTYRYPADGPDVAGLLSFLEDPKETEELAMVVDEELKMLCGVGDLGGYVRGPYLREMAHLAHTEFEIRGRTTHDVRDVLSATMFAATVTGSPLESACRVLAEYEPSGRGYYAGALALFGRDGSGERYLDSPILIRTADIAADGRLRMPVGATLVRDSDPRAEADETRAKAAGMLAALGIGSAPPGPVTASGAAGSARHHEPRRLSDDPRVPAMLAARRGNLAPFWLERRTPATPSAGSTSGVLVIDAEDSFTTMLAHVVRCTGWDVRIRRFDDGSLDRELARHRGRVILGPGPGDPDDEANPRMRALRELSGTLVERARAGGPGVLGVCLGHQLVARELGLRVARRAEPHQGTQRIVDVFGELATVGFYHSFGVHADAAGARELAREGIELSADPGTGEVLALRGSGVTGVQFHPESVLTLSGPEILASLLCEPRSERSGMLGIGG